jgi:site-specific DNA recombinase
VPEKRTQVRCAIYTRKSTEEGLDQEFNSLDAQREAGEAFIASQKHEGWKLLSEHYDDGGYSGGNLERPALKRLLAEVEAGKIDCVVVYKVDRLSRSLLDFARLVDAFDKRRVSFVAVTQQFNTNHSLGRLTLNILLSFAQFEREIIAERTRDKVHAAKRKGKWIGGHPPLGYDVAAGGGRLIVNEEEAQRVRETFDLYLEHRSITKTLENLDRRGWRTKGWTTQEGKTRAPKPFVKSQLHRLLSNPVYLGKSTLGKEVFDGEHEAIVEQEVWDRVQSILRHNGRTCGSDLRNKYGALLRGLLHCHPCGTAMVHTYSAKGERRYRYYVCLTAQQRGWNSCPTKSVNAQAIEQAVVEQVRALTRDPKLVERTLAEATAQHEASLAGLRADVRAWRDQLRRLGRRLADEASSGGNGRLDWLADIQEEISRTERRLSAAEEALQAAVATDLAEGELRAAIVGFDSVWQALKPVEQERVLKILLEQVTYEGETGQVGIRFRSNAWKKICATKREPA